MIEIMVPKLRHAIVLILQDLKRWCLPDDVNVTRSSLGELGGQSTRQSPLAQMTVKVS
jgi:hypothetical protein